MALPIASTPTLEGKEAEDFIKMANDNLNKSVSEEEFAKIIAAVEAMNKSVQD